MTKTTIIPTSQVKMRLFISYFPWKTAAEYSDFLSKKLIESNEMAIASNSKGIEVLRDNIRTNSENERFLREAYQQHRHVVALVFGLPADDMEDID